MACWVAGISWRDVEIHNEPGSKPQLTLRGGALEAAEQLGITKMPVTISHCHTHATATVVAVGSDD